MFILIYIQGDSKKTTMNFRYLLQVDYLRFLNKQLIHKNNSIFTTKKYYLFKIR